MMEPRKIIKEESQNIIYEESQLIEELYGPGAKFNQIITGIEREWKNHTYTKN